MFPTPRGPREGDSPLEGELLSSRRSPMPDIGARLGQALQLFWFVSLAATGWLLWLTLRGGPSSVLDILLALLLAAPLTVLTLVMVVLDQLRDLMCRASGALDAHRRAGMERGDPRMVAIELRYTMAELRDKVGGLALLRFMLTPGFFAAVGLSVLATLVMIPVALFTLLLELF
ncbi:MAG: hypothetical protein ABWU16_02390 [Halothiobacillaceae bacterium]